MCINFILCNFTTFIDYPLQFSGVIFRVFYVEDYVICKQWEFYFSFPTLISVLWLLWLELPKLFWLVVVRMGTLVLFLIFRGNPFNFTPFRITFAVSLSYTAFIMLKYVPSVPDFWRVLIRNGCWGLSKTFCTTIKWFLSFIVLIWSHWLTCKYWRTLESLEKKPTWS